MCPWTIFCFFSLHFSWEIHLCGSLWLHGSVPTLTITRFSSHRKNCLLDEFLTPLEERMAVSSHSPLLLPITAGTQDLTFPGLVLDFKEILSSGCSRFCCLFLSLSFFLTLLYIWKTHLKCQCTFFCTRLCKLPHTSRKHQSICWWIDKSTQDMMWRKGTGLERNLINIFTT